MHDGDTQRVSGATVVTVVAVAAFAARALAIAVLEVSDAWWHLATGRLIIGRGAVPRVDTFTYTHQGEPFVVHQWLFDLTAAVVDRLAGPIGLTILVALLVVAVSSAALLVDRRATRHPVGLLAAVVAVAATSPAWSLRGLLPSLVLTIVLVAVQPLPRRRRILATAVTLLIWAQVHGSFALAVAIVAVHAVGEIVDRRRGLPGDPVGALVAGGVGALVTLVNPYGWRLHTSILEATPVVRDLASEWSAPPLSSPTLLLVVGLVAVALLVAIRHPGDVSTTDVLLLLAAAALAFAARRSTPVGAALAVLPAARVLATVRTPFLERLPTLPRGVAVATVVVITGLLLTAPVTVLARRGSDPARHVDGEFPVQLAASVPAGARVFTLETWGSLVTAVTDGEALVNADVRIELAGVAGATALVATLDGGDEALERLASDRVSHVLVPGTVPLVGDLERDRNWQLVAEDDRGRVLYSNAS